MNLDQIFCASNCGNLECKKMLSFSKAKAAESKGKRLKYADLSGDCKDYLKVELVE